MVHNDQCAGGDYTEAARLHFTEPAGLPWITEDRAIAESKNNGTGTYGGAVQRPGGSSGQGE